MLDNIQAKFLPLYSPSTPWVGSICQNSFFFLLKMVMVHVPHYVSNNFVLTHTLDPWGGVKKVFLFSENGHVAYQIKGNEL